MIIHMIQSLLSLAETSLLSILHMPFLLFADTIFAILIINLIMVFLPFPLMSFLSQSFPIFYVSFWLFYNFPVKMIWGDIIWDQTAFPLIVLITYLYCSAIVHLFSFFHKNKCLHLSDYFLIITFAPVFSLYLNYDKYRARLS